MGVFLIVSLCLVWGLVLGASNAYADDVSDAQAALDAAEAQMSQIQGDYDKIAAELSSIQGSIDSTAAEALEAQDAVIAGRESLGNTARSQYRSNSAESLLSLILGSTSFDELLHNITYIGAVMQYQADEVAAQKERVANLNKLSDELNSQKDSQQRALDELAETKSQAESVVSQASAKLQSAKDAKEAEAARLAALQAAAANMTVESNTVSTEISSDATTINRTEAVPDSTTVVENPDENAPSGGKGTTDTGTKNNGSNNNGSSNENKNSGSNNDNGSKNNGGEDNSGSGWKTGVASAYGGSTDPYVDNPCTTATGDVCDDYSMGVAIPMSWSNYSSYLGRTVQISYNGMTVYATINDCGGMGGGSRSLDLQPGVWKAFGFSSCSAWGLRTVSYRIL